MSRVTFSVEAERDLGDVFAYIARDKPRAAAEFVKRIEEKCRLLARFPDMGTIRDDLSAGLRIFSVAKYAIVYRARTDDILIVRVLSGHRDIDSLFA